MDEIEALKEKLEALKKRLEEIKKEQSELKKACVRLSEKDLEDIVEAIMELDFEATSAVKAALLDSKKYSSEEADDKAHKLMDKYRTKEKKFIRLLDKKLGLK